MVPIKQQGVTTACPAQSVTNTNTTPTPLAYPSSLSPLAQAYLLLESGVSRFNCGELIIELPSQLLPGTRQSASFMATGLVEQLGNGVRATPVGVPRAKQTWSSSSFPCPVHSELHPLRGRV